MNKNLANIEQLLLHNYSLDDAMQLCGYQLSDRQMLENKFKNLLIKLKYANGNKLNAENKEKIEINIL